MGDVGHATATGGFSKNRLTPAEPTDSGEVGSGS